ncbi:hypothetical protein J8J40_32705, partial [Mycobacterium tuberculosis]|nr:hypothetical protein [Mycobacterium tuberculosis]
MDAVVVKLPALVADLRALEDALAGNAAANGNLQPRLDLAVADGHVRGDLDGLLKSLDTAAASHGDGTLKAALAGPRGE